MTTKPPTLEEQIQQEIKSWEKTVQDAGDNLMIAANNIVRIVLWVHL